MENEAYVRPVFVCALCDTAYESVVERMQCEQSCLKNKEEEEKRAAAEKKIAEKKLRKDGVDAAIENALRLINAYIEDYGSYEYDQYGTKNHTCHSRTLHYFK